MVITDFVQILELYNIQNVFIRQTVTANAIEIKFIKDTSGAYNFVHQTGVLCKKDPVGTNELKVKRQYKLKVEGEH